MKYLILAGMMVASMSLLTTPTYAAKNSVAKNSVVKDSIAKKTIELKVTDEGFEPSSIEVAPNTEVTLKITRVTNSTCAKQIQVPSLKIKHDLPLNKTVTVNLGKLNQGEIKFGCAMDMMVSGVIFVK